MPGAAFGSEEYVLSSNGLSRINTAENKPFWFVVGGKEYECTAIQALFISRAVQRTLKSDSTIDRFTIDGAEYQAPFDDIISLMEGRSIILNERNCPRLCDIARALENEELLSKCIAFVLGNRETSVENCVIKLRTEEQFDLPKEEELEFVASHFFEIDKDELKELTCETLEAVISHRRLCLANEDSLLDFVVSLGKQYSSLFGYIECRFLSLEGIDLFIESVSEMIDCRIWNSISRRLRCELSNRTPMRSRFRLGSEFPYTLYERS
jgi:hypothetical protein